MMDEKKNQQDSTRRALVVRGVAGAVSSSGRATVLDEDAFIGNLERIIERDFFPDLERLKLKSRYLEALKHNDYETARQIYSELLSARAAADEEEDDDNPAATPLSEPRKRKLPSTKTTTSDELPYSNSEPPAEFEDESRSTTSGGGGVRLKSAKKRLPNLDGFLSANTSEDNVSFETLIREAEKKETLKTHQSWLHEKELLHQIKQEKLLSLENGDGVASGVNTSQLAIKPVDTWTYTSKNTLMYAPEGARLTDEEERELARKTRVINHSNTRFVETPVAATTTTPAASTPAAAADDGFKRPGLPLFSVAPKIGIDGKELKKATPRIRGYGFVDASPSPAPGSMAGDESPMMTWGEIESTPFRLDPSASPLISGGAAALPEFKIAELTDREKLALDLEEKASAARRKKKQEALAQVQRSLAVTPSPNARATPSPFAAAGSGSVRTPTTLAEKITGMSPAAQRLLAKNIKAANTPIRASGLSSSIFPRTSATGGASVVASPSVTPSSMDKLRSNLVRPGSAKSTSGSATPSRISGSVKQSSSSSSVTNLTDNLLKLPNH